ncbi:hypothetical protein BRC77_08150 [Halobacteriales archaeon QH_8_64_26]|nr:MAG: hypothetical protein BRC77_08150 [Halobacteriales archaeon QH_8_64_26]
MNRRRLLASSGTIAGSLLAGCFGEEDSPGSNAETRTETTTTSTATPSPTSTQRPTTESNPSPANGTTDSPASTRSTTAGQPTGGSATRSQTSTGTSTLRTRRLTVTDRACGNPTDEGAIGFENGRVTLTGTITGSDGCATAVLGDVTYDRAADRLRVVITTGKDSGGGAICTQCLTEIDYEASVALENGTPGTVVLVHRGTTGETRVATASP